MNGAKDIVKKILSDRLGLAVYISLAARLKEIAAKIETSKKEAMAKDVLSSEAIFNELKINDVRNF